MKESLTEFIEFLTKPMGNGWTGWTILIIIWAVVLMVLGMILYGLAYAVNFWFVTVQDGSATIQAKYFEEAHYSTIYVYNAATKTSLPQTTYHPDAWKLILDIDGSTDSFYVSSSDYLKTRLGQLIKVTYKAGRLWKSISIQTVLI